MFKTTINRVSQTSAHLVRPSTTARFMASSQKPTGLIAKSGIELLTFGTPNGHKASIILEELKEAYGKDYVFQSINIGDNIQKESWFTKINPNGRIPAIVDHDRNDFAVFETIAIMMYLTRHYDPEHKFSFADPDDASRAEQWMAWQQGGVGPMQGQANHFRMNKERQAYPIQRYTGETERLYGVLDHALQDKEYLVGGKYSIADIANFSWVNFSNFAGIDLAQWPNLQKWWERIEARPAVQKGTSVPQKSKMANREHQRRLKEEEEFAETQGKLKEFVDKAKEQYGYKYSSP